MTLQRLLTVYLGLLHLAALAVVIYYRSELGYWLFAIELGLLASFLVGYKLIRFALEPLDFVKSFSDILNEREFASRFSKTGQQELDQIILLYNQMLETLYQERLRIGEQQGFLERFIQATPVGVVILSFDHKITLANRAAGQYLEQSNPELVGKTLSQLDSELAVILNNLKPGDHELIHWKAARRLRVERQQFVDRGFDRDFLLIEELTALLNESERTAYEKLIRMMSHEVNNTIASTNSLLQSCLNYSQQINEQDRDDFENALDVAITRNERLNRFMQGFAQVVKLPQPNKQPTDLSELLTELETMFRETFKQRNITCNRTGDFALPLISLDRDQIEQALINIIKNAIEAIGENGHIELFIEKQHSSVTLKVIDTGKGLDAENKDQLFSPFYTSKINGQGLGLTLVKEVFLRHGYEFELFTKTDGRTEFSIHFGQTL